MLIRRRTIPAAAAAAAPALIALNAGADTNDDARTIAAIDTQYQAAVTCNDGRPAFEYKLWFTDTYVRTRDGWRYAFGQASLPLPQDQDA
ncbi:MAG: hypothetical protein ACREXP_07615 [Steroidobacteraceae bacterium]